MVEKKNIQQQNKTTRNKDNQRMEVIYTLCDVTISPVKALIDIDGMFRNLYTKSGS